MGAILINTMTNEPNYRSHTNKENLVKCPYCGEEKRSRGLYLHVYRSSDDKHGPHKEVPDDWEKVEAEVIGKADQTVNVPTHKEYDHQALLCKWCGERFKGTHGLSVHLSRVNDSLHPKDAKIETSGIRVPVGPDADEDEIEKISDEHGLDLDAKEFTDEKILKAPEGSVASPEPSEVPDGHVPIPDLSALAAHYEGRGSDQCADDLRSLIQKYR